MVAVWKRVLSPTSKYLGGKEGGAERRKFIFLPCIFLQFPPVRKRGKRKSGNFLLSLCLIFSPSSSPCVTRQKPKGRSIPSKESEKKGKKKKHHNNFEKSGANKALRGGEEGEEGLSYSDPVIRGSGRKSPPPFLPSFKFFDLEARGQSEKKLLQKHMCRREGLCWRREATFESFFCEVLFVAARVILFVGGIRSLPLVLSE